ncbi:MAG: DNA-directed RNA polymerase subunit omega [Bacteroidales bacterium]|nr:DNA-directed RNA polymerase subunit omega [Bacteroidales bacterium]MCR5192901.1 DNA-directed RNA polymerase subunit omega [Bacteroidales bacterium]
METKKNRPVNTTITRNTELFSEGTNNIYETVAVLSKRSNQIASDMKRELHKKIEEFSSGIDTMDEIYENREQIEVVRHYEQLPKPTLQATQEYLNNEIYFRNPAKEDQNMQRLEAMENEAIAEGATEKKNEE